jgi:hypothetical protein
MDAGTSIVWRAEHCQKVDLGSNESFDGEAKVTEVSDVQCAKQVGEKVSM